MSQLYWHGGQLIDDLSNYGVLAHQKHARTVVSPHQELAEMARHGLEIVADKNSILLRGERKDFGVGNSL